MLKQFLTFSLAVFLCACAGGQLRQIPPQVRAGHKVNFFAAGHTQAAFKVDGRMDGSGLEGVLIAKKIGDEDFEVSVMTSGAYRVLQATVTPAGIAYRHLFPDADTSVIRGRINQFLSLLLLPPGDYQRYRISSGVQTVTYKNKTAKVQLFYHTNETYPYAAKTVTLLNTADLFYNEYAPADDTGLIRVPHELVYQDGNIEITLTLISLK